MSAKRKTVRTATSSAGKGVLIAHVLEEVQRALQNVQNRTAAPGFPKLEAVVISLQTVIVKSVGGIIEFLVFTFGRSWEKEVSHEMVLTLTPPPPSQAAAPTRSLAEELEDAIVEAAEGVKKAASGTPPLSLATFKLALSFVVTEETSGGIKFTIAPITFELSGKLKKKAIHTIELSFKR